MTTRLIPDATTGTVLAIDQGEDPVIRDAVIPNAGTAFDLDGETNVALLADILVNRSQYTIVVGPPRELHKNGVAQPIAPDGPDETDRKALPSRKAQIETYMALSDLPVPTDLADIAAGSNAAAIVAYINGTLVPRINQLDTLVARTNANTNAGQGIFQILRYIGKKLGFID